MNLPTGMQATPIAGPLSDYVQMWVLYERPTDYPNGFVGRLHLVGLNGYGPTDRVVFGETLDSVREQLPPGLVNIGRASEDEPQIAEAWL